MLVRYERCTPFPFSLPLLLLLLLLPLAPLLLALLLPCVLWGMPSPCETASPLLGMPAGAKPWFMLKEEGASSP